MSLNWKVKFQYHATKAYSSNEKGSGLGQNDTNMSAFVCIVLIFARSSILLAQTDTMSRWSLWCGTRPDLIIWWPTLQSIPSLPEPKPCWISGRDSPVKCTGWGWMTVMYVFTKPRWCFIVFIITTQSGRDGIQISQWLQGIHVSVLQAKRNLFRDAPYFEQFVMVHVIKS